MGRWLARLMDAQAGWAKPLGAFNTRWIGALLKPIPAIKDLLHGRWLGHPLHGALTDVPVGALTVSIVLDLVGQPGAADVALVVGILGMLASALTGAADYVDTFGTTQTRATLHSTLMVVSLVVFLVSLAIRAGAPADRTPAIALSILAYLVLAAGAYVGGDVVYALGNMVDRHAWRSKGTKWAALDLGGVTEIPEGTPVKAKAGPNALVLVRTGSAIHALHDTCAHAGGPLSEGKVVDGCIECPWHGSRFRLSDGAPRRGPTVYDQPAYEVRAAEGGAGYEVRRKAR